MSISEAASGLKLLVCTAILCCWATLGSSQSPAFRSWDRGPLTWDDFRVLPARDSVHGRVFYEFKYGKVKFHLGDTLVKRLVFRPHVDRKHSWHDPAFRTSAELAFHQFVFDEAEIGIRMIQEKLECGQGFGSLPLLMERIDPRTRGKAWQMATLMAQGDSSGVRTLLAECRTDLDRLRQDFRPAVRMSASRLGILLGAGKLFLSPDLAEEFTSPALMSLGFVYGYHRYVLLFSFDAGSAQPGPSPEEIGSFIAEEKPSLGQMQISLGYQFEAAHNCKLIPYAGLGFMGISSGEDEDGTYRAWETRRPVAGAYALRPFHRLIQVGPGPKEYAEFGAFADLRVAPLDLGNGTADVTFTAMAGIYVTANPMKSNCRPAVR